MNIKPLFIGPKAENIKIYEQLILDIVRSSGYFRKNFHPEDKPVISEMDKLSKSFQTTKAKLEQAFLEVNADLKRGVPTYHPRHIGHMFGDLLIPALVGYFSTMLGNPNNVVGEVSPVTTKMEMDFISDLAKMVGYGTLAKGEGIDGSWGHLTNGGTTANIEALWLARNLKYFPVSLKLLSKEKNYSFLENTKVSLPSGSKKSLKAISFIELFDLSTEAIYNLRIASIEAVNTKESKKNFNEAKKNFDKAIKEFSVQNIGVAGIHLKVNDLPLPKLFVTKTLHYSWEKALDILGIGKNQLVKIDVDNNFRLDIDALKKSINGSSVLAVVGVLGTTEEGVLDPIHKIVKLRDELHKQNKSFFIHIDAAYGGYFMSLLHTKDNKTVSTPPQLQDFFKTLINNKEIGFEISKEDINLLNKFYKIDNDWTNSLLAVREADSITIDPHKLGYVPYPAGSVMYKNAKSKDFLVQVAPYLAEGKRIEQMFLGKWSLEGSRPGATATACYLSTKILPLNQAGYGQLMVNTMLATAKFAEQLDKFNKIESDFKIIRLYTPETNIFCYIVSAPGIIKNPNWLNHFTKVIFNKMSVSGAEIIPNMKYFVSKSEWGYKHYKENIKTILSKAGIDVSDGDIPEDYSLTYLRSTFMNPLTIGMGDDFYIDFFKEITEIAENSIQDIMLEIINEENNEERIKILWIENEKKIEQAKRKMVLDDIFGKYLRIDFVEKIDENIRLDEYKLAIVDLNLATADHTDFKLRKTGYEAINEIEKQIKDIIIYSTYLSDKKHFKTIENETIKNNIEFFDASVNFKLVAKSENDEQNIKNLTNQIFNLLQ